MKVKEFNSLYNKAKYTIVLEDEWFNTMGWIWLSLTEKQYKKMYSLLLSQGAIEIFTKNGRYIDLKNGMLLRRNNNV